MKNYFIFFFFILFLITGVSASGFSPSSLIFEMSKNEQECQNIYLSSESSKIFVSDVWAENENSEWMVKNFKKSPSEHGLSVSYDKDLGIDEREVKVCISGVDDGEYHGAIVFREEQEGDSIVQMAVW